MTSKKLGEGPFILGDTFIGEFTVLNYVSGSSNLALTPISSIDTNYIEDYLKMIEEQYQQSAGQGGKTNQVR